MNKLKKKKTFTYFDLLLATFCSRDRLEEKRKISIYYLSYAKFI